MVFKKGFTLLVATGTTPFFAVVSIISDNHCGYMRFYCWCTEFLSVYYNIILIIILIKNNLLFFIYLGKQFFLEDDKFYDEECYKTIHSLICDQCCETIDGHDIRYITYHEKFIHHRCFVCNRCQKKLSTAQKFKDVRTTVKGELQCIPCYDSWNATRTSNPIVSRTNSTSIM